jgi:1,4-dihydroxy-2-naphthoyl-CoA hydrolase
MIWKQTVDLATLNAQNRDTAAQTLGIEFTELGDNYLKGTMRVTQHAVQPMRLLHGGVSVVLIETLGSVASNLCLDNIGTQVAVGVEVNANHLKSVREGGMVTGLCKPLRVGRALHVWEVEIRDEKGDLVCVGRLTTAVVSKR